MVLDIRSRINSPTQQDLDMGQSPLVSLLQGGQQGFQQGQQAAQMLAQRKRKQLLAQAISQKYPELAPFTNEDTVDSIVSKVAPVMQKKSAGLGGTSNISLDTASPAQVRLAQSYLEGKVRSQDIGWRDKSTITLLANELASKQGIPFVSYGGDVKAKEAIETSSGQTGRNVTSINTALAHAGELNDSFQNLGNTDVRFVNIPINKLKEYTNDPDIISTEVNLVAVRDELATAFKGTAATDEQVSAWTAPINSSLTPAQAQAAISKAADLLEQRLNSIAAQRSDIMNNSPLNRNLLSDKGKNVLDKLRNPKKGTNKAKSLRDKYGY